MKKKGEDIQSFLFKHYSNNRNRSQTKRSITKVIPSLNSKSREMQKSQPYQTYLPLQKTVSQMISTDAQLKILPRNLILSFDNSKIKSDQLKPIPYTYETVQNFPIKKIKRKPRELAEWVIQTMGFKIAKKQQIPHTKIKQKKNPLGIHRFTPKGLLIAKKFQRTVKKILQFIQMRKINVKNIFNKRIKELQPFQYFNSKEFFMSIKSFSQQSQRYLQENNKLAHDFDNQFMTALHWTAKIGNIKILKLLICKYNANIDSRDIEGRTPFHLAVINKKTDCIYRLFIEGSNIDIYTMKYQNAFDLTSDIHIKFILDKLKKIKSVAIKKKIIDKERKLFYQKSVRQILESTIDF